MVANAAEIQCPHGGNASPPGRDSRSVRNCVRPRGRTFPTRRSASSARASAADRRACASAHRSSGNPSDTAGASEGPTGLGSVCLGVFGAAGPESASDSTGSVSPRAGEGLAPIAINAPTLSVDPLVEQAYQAFQRNDLAVARDGYQRALLREPTNRDALLGPRGHRRAQRPTQLGRSALSQAARDRPARQPRNGEPHLAARPA